MYATHAPDHAVACLVLRLLGVRQLYLASECAALHHAYNACNVVQHYISLDVSE